MLKRLKLQNVALIEIIEINFEKGLNVFTGESGSGKSLILDSLNSLFGGTNIPLNHLIRPGKTECFIQASFDLTPCVRTWLEKNNFSSSIKNADELNIERRSVIKNSKIISKFYLNQISLKRKYLESLGILLLDFAGQSDTFLFSSKDYLLSIIDGFGNDSLKEINSKVKTLWQKCKETEEQLNLKLLKLEKDKDKFNNSSKMLKILEDSNLNDDNEIDLLKTKQIKLANNFELKNLITDSLLLIDDSNYEATTISSFIGEIIKCIKKVIQYDQNANNFYDQIISIESQLENFKSSLNQYLYEIDNDDNNLNIIQQRIFELQNIEKSFSMNLPDLIKKRDELRNFGDFNYKEDEINQLKEDLRGLNTKLIDLYNMQSKRRKEVAERLENSVTSLFTDLGLQNSIFKIDFKPTENSCNGHEDLRFLFSANPDQSLAPLSQVISGGEMSRFLLALKSQISDISSTLFFDEIDNGLSGKSLLALIRLMKNISSKRQVLCITHHPLLAASANVHFKVQKNIKNGFTCTSLSKLITKKERQSEIAELIGGGFEEANDYALTLIDKAAA